MNEIPEDVDASGLCVDRCTYGVRGWCDNLRSQQEVTKTRTLKFATSECTSALNSRTADAILFLEIPLNVVGILPFRFESDINKGYLLRTPVAQIANYLSH